VQIVYSSRRGSRDIERIRSAHYDAELEDLKAAARQRMAAGQSELDLGPARWTAGCQVRCRSPRGQWAACSTRWRTRTAPLEQTGYAS